MARTSKKRKNRDVAVIYARYSSHNQKDASIEQQVNECRAHATSLGLNIVHVYADRAISGKTDNRPSFQQMMRDAEQGQFSYVLSWKSNRIGRNMLQAMTNELRLNELGVQVLYAEEDFDDTAAGRFALRSMMNVNQFYIENMAEDVKRGMMDNARKAKVNGKLPFGYKKGPNGEYVEDEYAAPVIKEIFERVAAGEALSEICNSLNLRGFKTSNGRPFGKSSFNALLHNERYRGIYIFGDVRIEGAIPRLVSDDLFYQVAEVVKTKKNPRTNRRRNKNGVYMLTGKLFCGQCGSPMVGVSGTSKLGDLHHYYVCKKKREKHTCTKKNVRRDVIEKLVAETIMTYCLRDEVLELIAEKTVEFNNKKIQESELGLLDIRLADTLTAIKNVMKAIEAGIITETTKARLNELENEKAELLGQIAKAKASIVPIDKDALIVGLQMFRDGDINDPIFRQRLIDTFIVAIYLYDGKIKLVFSFIGANTIEISSETQEKIISDENIEIIADSVRGVRTRAVLPYQLNLIRTPVKIFTVNGVFVLQLIFDC